jgi:hypothetical protein
VAFANRSILDHVLSRRAFPQTFTRADLKFGAEEVERDDMLDACAFVPKVPSGEGKRWPADWLLDRQSRSRCPRA